MDAATDYAAVKALLSRPLPAYVSYTARLHMKFDAIVHDDTRRVVVRTRDHRIVKGATSDGPPAISIGSGPSHGDEPVTNPAFDPDCYEATGARAASFDGVKAEVLALRDTCAKASDDKDFDTLYIDAATHRPIAAVGSEDDRHVAMRLSQRFTSVQGHTLPTSLDLRVQGSGIMTLLDITYQSRYRDYRFSSNEP